MSEAMPEPSPPSRRVLVRRLWLFIAASAAVHLGLYMFGAHAAREPSIEDVLRLHLPAEVEFGLADDQEGGQAAPEPAPAKAVEKPAPVAPKVRAPKADPDGVFVRVDAGTPPQDAGVPTEGEADAAVVALLEGERDEGEVGEASGMGLFPGAEGEGGTGLGGAGGTGRGYKGATIALNVDLERVRQSALLLETEALLEVIPEWQLLLAGSGLDPVEDLERVFVATPNLERSSLVVAGRVRSRGKIERAVQTLASERGQPAAFRDEGSAQVAPWWNRGPTKRQLAITHADRFVITRQSDLRRVLGVARSLERTRVREGFDKGEVQKEGGLLAMRGDEAVALWVEGVRHYVASEDIAVPSSLRMSIERVDEFKTRLRASGRYESNAQAQASLEYVDAFRKRLTDHPRVIYLGLKSALDNARIEREDNMLVMNVELTLHQTRYLMGYVSKALSLKKK
jgi:hypothetical protein